MTAPMISLTDVSLVFEGHVGALNHVSLDIAAGETVGLVGESGSGKTTLCRVLVGLAEATAGTVAIEGRPLDELIAADPLAFRRKVQLLLQDAVASLSPRMRIGRLLEEPLAIHGMDLLAGRRRIADLLKRLGLPQGVLDKYPHQVSGGQARRVAILRALMLGPSIIVADEPTAGLDVSVQGDLINLLMELRSDLGLTYLIVSHNLNVIRRIADRTVVMYLGQIVEAAPTPALFAGPAHPYSAALLSTNPAIDPRRRRTRIVLDGEIPSVVSPPAGCRFHTRCPIAATRCRAEEPPLRPLLDGRQVRCHFPLTEPEGAAAFAAAAQRHANVPADRPLPLA